MKSDLKPMLAHEFEKHKDKVKYPCIVQPKLDGIRCIATIKDGKCLLHTRSGNIINSVPHINEELEKHYHKQYSEDIVFDGELTLERGSFDQISSIVRKKVPKLDGSHFFIRYSIFDIASSKEKTHDRFLTLINIYYEDRKYVRMLSPSVALNEGHVYTFLSDYEEQGFEGVMVRDRESLYENKRSFGLLKLKRFYDEEYLVLDVIEGKGKLKGKAGSFVCSVSGGMNGELFKVKMACEESKLKDYLTDFEKKYKYKMLTVKFQEKTKRGVPRFPIGLRFKEEV